MIWQKVALGELCNPKQHKTVPIKELTSSGYPVFGANGQIGFYPRYTHADKAIAITCRGATCGTVNVTPEKSYITGNAMALDELNEQRVNFSFLVHVLRHQGFSSVISGAAQPQITRGPLLKYTIPLPPIEEQRRIAAILDQADELHRLRHRALNRLDTLNWSIFCEMFGDPAVAPNRWPKAQLVDLATDPSDIRCGPFGTQLQQHEFVESGVPLWGIKHVNRNFEVSTSEYVSAQKFKALENYSLVPGDIVMTRKGTIGNCSVYPNDFEVGVMHSDLLRFRLNPKVANPRFVSDQLRFNRAFQRQLALMSGGAIMAGINVSKLKLLEGILPPLNLQNEYAKAAALVDARRHELSKSKDKLNILFCAIQQKAFRGEL